MRRQGWMAVLAGAAVALTGAPAAAGSAKKKSDAPADACAKAKDAAGCRRQAAEAAAKAVASDELPAPAPATDTKPVLLGITRPVGVEAAAAAATGLDTYLSRMLGVPVQVKLFAEAMTLAEAIATGRVDGAWLTPVGYVVASEYGPLTPLVRLVREGFTSYRSVIFVRADSPAKALDDLKGRTMAWVEPGSASGRMFPRAHMKRLGRDPDQFFASQVDLPDHRAVCLAVLEGRADAGASLSDERKAGEPLVADGCRSSGLDPAKFRVIEKTEPVPNDVVAVREKFDPKLAARLRSALLELPKSDEGRKAMTGIFQADGFGPVSDADFAPVRAVQATLELK